MVRRMAKHHTVAAVEVVVIQLELLAANQQLLAAIDRVTPLDGHLHVAQHLAGGTPLTPARLAGEGGNGYFTPGAIPEFDPILLGQQVAASQWQQGHQTDDFL